MGVSAGKALVGIEFDKGDLSKLKGQAKSAGSGVGSVFSSHIARYAKYAALGLGAGIVAGTGLAIKSAADFQQQINILGAVSGATSEKLGQLSDFAIKLGADVKLPGTSAKDAADAMTELSKAGLSIEDTMAAARPVLLLSAAAQISNADAATYTATALNSFNLAGSQAAHVADLLAGAANASAGDVPDMAEALQYAGAAAHAAGLSIDETVAAIAEMSNKGLSGSVAGSSLAQALRSLQAPSKAAATSMKDLGINVYDAQGKMLPMDGVIQQFTTHMEGLTQKQQNQALATIFGSRAVQAARIVFLGGTKAYDKMRDSVSKTGSAQRLAAAQTKGFNGALQAFTSTIETLAIVVGLRLLPVATKVVGAITNIVNGISKIAGAKTPEIAISLAFRMAGHVYKSLTEALFGETKRIRGHGDTRVGFTVETKGIVDKLMDAFRSAPWAEIGKTVGAGIGAGLVFTNDAVSRLMGSLANGIIANKGALAEASLVVALQIVNTATDPSFWQKHWQLILGAALAVFPVGRVASIGEKFGAVFGGRIVGALFRIVDRIPLRFQGIVQRVIGVFGRIPEAFRGITDRAFALVQAVLSKLPPFVLRIAIGAARLLGAGFRLAVGLVSSAVRSILGLIDKITGRVDKAGNEVVSLGGKIVRAGLKFLAWIGILNTVEGVIQTIISAIGDLVSAISNIHWPSPPGWLSSAGGALGGLTSHIPGIATGGTTMQGGWAVVGERGPELVNFPSGATVYDAKQSAAAMGGMGAGGLVVKNYITLDGREIAHSARTVVDEAFDQLGQYVATRPGR